MTAILEYIVANKETVVLLVLAVLGVFSVVAKLTPNEVDNKVANFLVKVVNALGLTKKEE